MFGEVDWRRRSDEEGKEKRVRNSDLEDLQKNSPQPLSRARTGGLIRAAQPKPTAPNSEPASHDPVELYANASVFVCCARRYSLRRQEVLTVQGSTGE